MTLSHNPCPPEFIRTERCLRSRYWRNESVERLCSVVWKCGRAGSDVDCRLRANMASPWEYSGYKTSFSLLFTVAIGQKDGTGRGGFFRSTDTDRETPTSRYRISAFGNPGPFFRRYGLTRLPYRYGASLRKMVKKMETSQHAKYTCAFCGKVTVKRQAVGIWNCKSCKRTTAGGAYTVSYVLSIPGRDSSSGPNASRCSPAPTKPTDHTDQTFLSTPAAAAMRSTLRRLREIAEV